MDNVTHSLIGAVIGQAGLKRLSGLAMPTLIIAANIPDIDAGCTIYGIESLAMRRGLTHGPIAMIMLPALLTIGMIAFDRWQTRRGTRPDTRLPVKPWPLFLLALIGTLSHPAFDWLNNYGVRLLEPFSSQWFYGDAIFIIDPWILAMLIAGVWLSRRRESAERPAPYRPARLAIAGVLGFVALNLGISAYAVDQARARLGVREDSPALIVANAVPLWFWKRELLIYDQPFYGFADFSLVNDQSDEGRGIKLRQNGDFRSVVEVNNLANTAPEDPALQAFLFWSRLPITVEENGRIYLRDQRFLDPRAVSRFQLELKR